MLIEKYTLTTIEEEAVPLTGTPIAESVIGHSLLLIIMIAFMVFITVWVLFQYLEKCRDARFRLGEIMTGYSKEILYRHRFDLKWLSDALYEQEMQRGEAAFWQSRTGNIWFDNKLC